MADPKPWEFQPGIDTGETYAAFSLYLSQVAPRRYTYVAMCVSRTVQTISSWARKDLWQERAAAWDKNLIAQRTAELEAVYRQDGREVAMRQLDSLRLAQSIVDDQLEKLRYECSQSEQHPRMKPIDIVRMQAESFKEERLIRGMATEIVEGDSDYSKLTDEELATLDALENKARKTGTP